MESITDKQDTNCSAFVGRDDLEHVEGDDADEHHREYQEGPSRGEGLEVVGVVEPDHQHWEADEEGNGEVDPKENINERRVNEASTDSCFIVSGANHEQIIMLTVIYSADQDCGETESEEGNEETLYGVLDEPQGLSGVEEELD